MIEFQDREEIIEAICAPLSEGVLLNIYGETGIGKSRLLQEAERNLREKNRSSVLVLRIDLEKLKDVTDCSIAVLRALLDQAVGRVTSTSHNAEQVAADIVWQLSELTQYIPVYLMFDTTEALQENDTFWDWLHKNVTEPLVVERRVKQIYAGRIPVPWRRFELRRAVKLWPLGPLVPVDTNRMFVEQALLQGNPALKEREDFQSAIDVVLEFSFGHPLLSEKLAAYVAVHWPPERSLVEYKRILGEQEVMVFIKETLFRGIEQPWIDILWWASALDWFDPTILQEYLKHVMSKLGNEPDYFFICGVARLRKHNRVIWQESRGDRLHGLIQDIVRQCFKTVDIDEYQHACLAAAETFKSIAAELSEENSYAKQFEDEAAIYRQRWQSLEEMTK